MGVGICIWWSFYPPTFAAAQLRIEAIPARPKLLQKNSLQRKCFGAMNFAIITKESLYKAKFLGLVSCKKGPAIGSNITKKIFWWNYFSNNYKDYYKEIVPRNYFVIISARMVVLGSRLSFLATGPPDPGTGF